MQEDQLLSGSIADNICYFDPSFDQERMIECARLAAIYEEIMAMPMTYNSLIGDMGARYQADKSNESCSREHSIDSRESCFWTRAQHIWTLTTRNTSTIASIISK